MPLDVTDNATRSDDVYFINAQEFRGFKPDGLFQAIDIIAEMLQIVFSSSQISSEILTNVFLRDCFSMNSTSLFGAVFFHPCR